jgi:hypothetical protein
MLANKWQRINIKQEKVAQQVATSYKLYTLTTPIITTPLLGVHKLNRIAPMLDRFVDPWWTQCRGLELWCFCWWLRPWWCLKRQQQPWWCLHELRATNNILLQLVWWGLSVNEALREAIVPKKWWRGEVLVNPRIIKQNGELFIMIAICECEYLHLLNSKINFSFEVHLSHEREWTPLTKRCHGRNGYQTYGVQLFSYVSCQRLDVFLKCSMACHPNERSIGFHHQTGAHVELQRQKM